MFFRRAILKTVQMCVALTWHWFCHFGQMVCVHDMLAGSLGFEARLRPLHLPHSHSPCTFCHSPTLLIAGTFLLSSLQGSIKKKIESFRRWSSASMKRPPKPKTKTLSLSSPVGDPEDLWLQEGDRRKLRPIVDSVFGQVCPTLCFWQIPCYLNTYVNQSTNINSVPSR